MQKSTFITYKKGINVTPCLAVAVPPCMGWVPIKNIYIYIYIYIYIIFELDNWPTNKCNNFKMKNRLSGEVILRKYIQISNVYWKVFDRDVSWSFGNLLPGNIVIFGVDNSSSRYSANR